MNKKFLLLFYLLFVCLKSNAVITLTSDCSFSYMNGSENIKLSLIGFTRASGRDIKIVYVAAIKKEGDQSTRFFIKTADGEALLAFTTRILKTMDVQAATLMESGLGLVLNQAIPIFEPSPCCVVVHHYVESPENRTITISSGQNIDGPVHEYESQYSIVESRHFSLRSTEIIATFMYTPGSIT